MYIGNSINIDKIALAGITHTKRPWTLVLIVFINNIGLEYPVIQEILYFDVYYLSIVWNLDANSEDKIKALRGGKTYHIIILNKDTSLNGVSC